MTLSVFGVFKNKELGSVILAYTRVIRTPVDNLLGYIYDKGMCIGSMYINGF